MDNQTYGARKDLEQSGDRSRDPYTVISWCGRDLHQLNNSGLFVRGNQIGEFATDVDSESETGNPVILLYGSIRYSVRNGSQHLDEPTAPVALVCFVRAALNS